MPDLTRRADVELDIEGVLKALPCDHKARELGQVLYRCRSLSWQDRWRIAKELLVYEEAKLAVTYQATEQDFATLLDRRLARIEQMKSETKLIRQQPAPTVEVKPPPPRVPDRRVRRI